MKRLVLIRVLMPKTPISICLTITNLCQIINRLLIGEPAVITIMTIAATGLGINISNII